MGRFSSGRNNEVNVYVGSASGPDEQELRAALTRSLLGLVWLRSTGAPMHLRQLKDLQLKLRSLGLEVPLLGLSTDQRLKWWRADLDVDPMAPPYDLELIAA